MTNDILNVLGGIGLYLFGMQIMTEALRRMASRQARAMLARFATTPFTGALSGAVITAVLQSSSAVLITTIGFVGAGMLSFPQAVGIIYGANIGTTITGWMVMALGLKLQLGLAALPLLFVAALMQAFAKGPWQATAQALAGFCLVFLGFDLMQAGTRGFEGWLTPDILPGDGLVGRALLMGIGMAFTIVVQSSSAGVATALVLLGSGAISLPQAAAMVVGMDIGTTFKSLLATIGGSRDMRRTAVAHVAYNVVTGTAAFLALGPATALLQAAFGGDPLPALVAFHTLFNVMGVALMLPFTGPFTRLIERLVPGGDALSPRPLDRALLADADAALDAARGASGGLASALLCALGERLRLGGTPAALAGITPQLPAAIDDIEDFLTRIQIPEGQRGAMLRHSALLHQFDHLHRLAHRAEQGDRIDLLLSDPALLRPAVALGAALRRAGAAPSDPAQARRLARLRPLIAGRMQRLRRSALLREHVGLVSPAEVFALTDALRWLDRAVHHAERIVHYGALAAEATPEALRASQPPNGD